MFTLILPDLLRGTDENLPPLATPAFNQILRFGRFQAALQSRAELYQNHLADRLAQPENCAYVSPVYQQTGLNSIQLIDGAGLGISQNEAQTWCSGLNQLYGNDAVFSVLRPDLWQIRLPENIDWQTPPLWDALGQLDDTAKAQGSQAAQWLQLSTEMQMWLHAHPLNQSRSVPVNAVWLWRGDNRPIAAPQLTGTDSPWRQQSSLKTEDMPHDFAAWQRVCADTQTDINQTALFSEDFVLPQQTGDVWQYIDTLAQWEQRFFAPIWQALVSGSLKNFTLVCQQGRLTVNAKAHRRFWKRAKTFNGKNL